MLHLIEDDDGHADLILDLLRDSGLTLPVRRWRQGEEAWQALTAEASSPHLSPSVLLMDIRMPRLDGLSLLKRLKAHPALRLVPVIMLTTSDDPKEIESCYAEGCAFFITKPIDFQRFSQTVQDLGRLLQVVQLPGMRP